jgi:16S rRNA (cytosine967-C5)-methyltransferase
MTAPTNNPLGKKETSAPATAGARAEAARIVSAWLRTGRFPDRLIEEDTPNRAFVVEMVHGVARQRRMLEWTARRCADREPDPAVWPFLLVGLYQILAMDRVAPHAAVHETVEAVKRSRVASAAGFVNGILRRVLRELTAIREELRQSPLGNRESHPDLLVERWIRRFGEEPAARLCRWNNERPSVTLHPNRRRIDVAGYLDLLARRGVSASPHPFAPGEFITLPHGLRIPDLPGYADGFFSVQDPSTLEAIRLLDPQPGHQILDACAAPGGKTLLIAERMEGRGRVVAMEKNPDRLRPLRENAARMALDVAEIVQGDAGSPEDLGRRFTAASFDRILLDVPCTNTGVLRRRPDARWRFAVDRLAELQAIQRAMLDAVAPLLKPDGILVYSTCSLEPEEGEDLVTAWLRDHPGFTAADSVSLFPPDSGTDGIFAAALRREEPMPRS